MTQIPKGPSLSPLQIDFLSKRERTHYFDGNIKSDTPCGAALVMKTPDEAHALSLTGTIASNDLYKVDCVCCLRALAAEGVRYRMGMQVMKTPLQPDAWRDDPRGKHE